MKKETKLLIWNELKSSEYGLTIQNIMNRTKLARGTVKPYLLHLMVTDNVIEVNYGQNVKVYFAKHKELKDNEVFNSKRVE